VFNQKLSRCVFWKLLLIADSMINIPGKLEKLLNGGVVCNAMVHGCFSVACIL
jgi:hypothetical protein